MLQFILFTHDDLDGVGCKVVYELAHQHLKKGVDYDVVNCTNGNIDDQVMKYLNGGNINKDTEITFADIVASRENLEYIVNNFSVPKIFDHHRTNFFATWVVPDAVIVPENELGVMQSGTSLIYQHYSALAESCPNDRRGDFTRKSKENQELLANFVDTIRSYDTYEWKTTNNIEAKKLQTLFTLLGVDIFSQCYIDRLINDKSYDLISKNDIKFVDAKINNEQRIIDSVTPDDVYQFELRGLKCAFSLGSFGVNISELSYQFLSKYTEFDVFIGFSMWRGGELSFRCIRDDLDLGKDFALPIGGGGHPKAAGAMIDETLREEIVQKLICFMNK